METIKLFLLGLILGGTLAAAGHLVNTFADDSKTMLNATKDRATIPALIHGDE